MAPGDLFSTPDAAAYDALAYVNGRSIGLNLEYAGVIRVDLSSEQYYATARNSGHETGASVGVNPGGNDVGLYRTHGDYSIQDPETGAVVRTGNPALDEFSSDQFSDTHIAVIDALAAQRPGFTGYLGTPSGNFLKYNPATDHPNGSALAPGNAFAPGNYDVQRRSGGSCLLGNCGVSTPK